MIKSQSRHALYATAALWNLSTGMFQVLIPLYALSLGFSIVKIGTIVALPVLGEVVARFAGSALSDRFGEARILQGCYFLMVLAGLALLGADSYLHLLGAQTLANCSRSIFWSSVQSLASQLPGASMGKKLGMLTAVNYAGAMVGFNLGGILAALAGYRNSFVALTAVAAACALLGMALPLTEPKPHGRTVWQITRGIARFLRYRQTWLTISVSCAGALPVSLTLSIYPIYLAQLGYGEGWVGAAVSLRSLGAIVTALMVGTLITLDRQRTIYATGMAGLAIFLVASGLSGQVFLLGIFIAALGAAGCLMDLLYQVQAAAFSKASDRSVAMASMGLGWNLSPFLAPIVMGWLVEAQGFRFAFFTASLFFLLAAAGTGLWHRLLAPQGFEDPEQGGTSH